MVNRQGLGEQSILISFQGKQIYKLITPNLPRRHKNKFILLKKLKKMLTCQQKCVLHKENHKYMQNELN